MEEYGKVVILENEVEAQLLGSILTDMGIDHILHTYHDLAYDGLFQMQKGWGHVEARLSDADAIREALDDLRKGEESDET